jgi:rhamnose transport system ATP-binding protein
VTALLQATDITKSFGAVRALKGVSFDLRKGEVHALVGENGAGKSTLVKVLTGALQPDSGTLHLEDRLVVHHSPRHACRLGIVAIYQQPALFPELSVAENIALADNDGRAWAAIDWRARRLRASRLLEQVGAAIFPDATAGTLTMPQQQLVEIAKALGGNPRVLIMDEPTASLGEADVENLFRIIDDLRRRGVAILYISHRFEEIFRIADRITVLRDGSRAATSTANETTPALLVRAMVGREIETVFPKQDAPIGEVVLDVRRLGCRLRGVHDVNLTLRRGEILGLAGLVGSGRTELAETLFGLSPADSGTIRLNGQVERIASPAEAVSHGLAYVPEDRRRHGVIMDMPISRNTTLADLRSVSRFGLLRFRVEERIAEDYMRRLATKAPSARTLVRDLSGGNQQKVALARWLITHPRVLILDEPTQGIDVGAKPEIYRLMGDLARSGMAILMISSELTEVLALSDRVAVMRRGTIAGILDRAEATPHGVMSLAFGTGSAAA